MKLNNVFFLLQFFLCSFVSAAESPSKSSFVLVSDIDDTLKITNVLSARHGLYNLFRGQNVFLGMSELYQEITHGTEPIIYLSGSLESFTERVQTLLVKKSGFPEGPFFLNVWGTFESWRQWITGRKFKRRKLIELAASEAYAGLPFLMVGDDTEHDFDIYDEFKRSHPKRALDIYIHQVKGKKLPDGVKPYSVALEIALNELEAGRLTHQAAKRVANAILDLEHPDAHKDNFRRLFPHFSICPKEFEIKLGPAARMDAELVALSTKVEADIREFCEHRIL